jgi:hypothetical protein
MANKLRLNIDLAQLQGALWFKSPKTGEQCLVIVPSKSRLKFYQSKKEGKVDSLYGSLEIVPFKNGPNDREDTHFVVEPTTREERESPEPPKLPIIGTAREYDNGPRPAARAVNPAPQQDSTSIAGDDDEIPF